MQPPRSIGDLLKLHERQIFLTLLSSTQNKTTNLDEIKETLRVTEQALNGVIKDLAQSGIVSFKDENLELSQTQRLQIAVKAIEAGADFEKVSQSLGWLEFEEIVARIFEENSYKVKSRFRFNAQGRRWEIDVLAMMSPLVVCAECKHWSKGLGDTTARRIVEDHLEKVRVLSENAKDIAEKIGIETWKKATFVPMTLSLQPAKKKIYRRIPVVSIFELPSFLSEFRGQMEWLAKYTVELPAPRPLLKQTRLKRKRSRRKKGSI